MTLTLGSRALSAGYKLAAFDQIGSTNSEAMGRARAGERGPIWLVTTEQTAGRGRRQRAWIAPRGNLASSILEGMDVAPGVAATLGFAAGLSLDAAVRAVSVGAAIGGGADPLQFRLKWPNDVLMHGAKVCGILIEQGHAAVVGIGLNVNQTAAEFEAAGLPLAGSLAAVTGRHFDTSDIARVLSEAGEREASGVLADLGVSSLQLDTPARGFSFRHDVPLDMRMDAEGSEETAAELLERLPEEEIARVLYEYGEERRSRRIARWIVERR